MTLEVNAPIIKTDTHTHSLTDDVLLLLILLSLPVDSTESLTP